MSDGKMIELCALWEKQGQNGETFLVGKLNGLSIMVFPNQHKKEDKHPDFRVMLAPDKREAPENRVRTKESSAGAPSKGFTTDDVPF